MQQEASKPRKWGPWVQCSKSTKPIGEGGNAYVYCVHHEEKKHPKYALKTLRYEHTNRQLELDLERFGREVRALQTLTSEHVVKVVDADVTITKPYFVMDLIRKSKGLGDVEIFFDLPIEQRLRLFLPVVQAMAEAHQHDILHRDIKPDNILVEFKDKEGKVIQKLYLTDFGLCKFYNEPDAGRTETGQSKLFGPMTFRPPEFTGYTGNATKASDVYMLGAVLFWVLTKQLPYHDRHRLQNHLPGPDTRLAYFLKVLDKSMVHHERSRYKDAQEMFSALEEAINKYTYGLPFNQDVLAEMYVDFNSLRYGLQEIKEKMHKYSRNSYTAFGRLGEDLIDLLNEYSKVVIDYERFIKRVKPIVGISYHAGQRKLDYYRQNCLEEVIDNVEEQLGLNNENFVRQLQIFDPERIETIHPVFASDPNARQRPDDVEWLLRIRQL